MASPASPAYALRTPASTASTRGESVYPPTFTNKGAHSGDTLEERKALYEKSITDPGKFWGEIAATFHWEKPFDPTKVVTWNYDKTKGKVHQEWFADGVTNMCYNCVDRHLPAHKDQVAF